MPVGQLLNLSEPQVLIRKMEQGLSCRVKWDSGTEDIKRPAGHLALRGYVSVSSLVAQRVSPSLTHFSPSHMVHALGSASLGISLDNTILRNLEASELVPMKLSL